ncbi:hypothetical protein BDZ91DRAFT_730105 [Kalaharituber pfeilii]|nr:hypothetical protein BDZ91DRAFT_730105 [Kalaharituber pfeilii]
MSLLMSDIIFSFSNSVCTVAPLVSSCPPDSFPTEILLHLKTSKQSVTADVVWGPWMTAIYGAQAGGGRRQFSSSRVQRFTAVQQFSGSAQQVTTLLSRN